MYSHFITNQNTQSRAFKHEGQKMSDTKVETKLDKMKQHGAFSWNELMTSDIEGAKTFYNNMFIWKMHDMEMDEPYTIATINEEDVAGLMPMPPGEENRPPMWGGYITVDNVENSMKQALKLGGKVLLEPRDIPKVGRICILEDPQGAMFTIVTYIEQN